MLLNTGAIQNWSKHVYNVITLVSLNITATPQHA